MSKYIITEEEQNKIKLYTAMTLPDSPSEKGMSPSTIKKFFYKFLDPLFQVLNAHLGLISSGITDALSKHDTSKIAHEYLINLIRNLQTQNTEQGTAITEHYTEVENSIKILKDEIDTRIDNHDKKSSAHGDIRQEIKNVLNKALDAYNLASGKSKIYPVRDMEEMLSQLGDGINVGDKFVLSDAKVPDFTLFAKNFEYNNDENVDDISNEDISNYSFVVGRNYHYNGYLLVPSESGIDTSKFAKASALDDAIFNFEETFDEINAEIFNTRSELQNKEEKRCIKTETAEAVTIDNDTEYNLGLRTSVILNLPSKISNDYECIVNFRSGTVATTFDSPDEINFSQDDCLEGKLYPVSNRIYEINVKNVGGILIAKVGACDYEVIE